MKYSGIAGLLAVVTAVTGAAIPKRDLENTAEADIAKLEKDLAAVKQALAEKKEEKRGVVGAVVSGVPLVGPPVAALAGPLKRDGVDSLVGELTEPVQSLTSGLLKRQVGSLLNGATEPLDNVPAVGPTAHAVVNGAGQLVDSVTGELLGGLSKRQVGSLLNGATEPLDNVPAVGPTAHAVVNGAGQLVDSVTGELLGGLSKRQVGSLLNGATEPLDNVPAVGPTAHAVVNGAGQLVDSVTGELLKRDVGNLLDTVEAPVKGLTNGLPVVGGILKRDVGNLLDTVEAPVKGLTNGLPVVGGILKRDDAISQLAGSLLPQLTNLGAIPENFNLAQLTSLLNVLNAKGLVGNLEQVLGSLLGGGLLKNVEGLLPVKRDNEISQLASGILPEVQHILPQGFGVEQLTGLLNVLNVNGLLVNVQSILGSLL